MRFHHSLNSLSRVGTVSQISNQRAVERVMRFHHSQSLAFRVWTLSIFAERRKLERVPRFQHSQNPLFRVWTLSNFAEREVGRVLRLQHSRNLPARVCFVGPAAVFVATMQLALQLALQQSLHPVQKLVAACALTSHAYSNSNEQL